MFLQCKRLGIKKLPVRKYDKKYHMNNYNIKQWKTTNVSGYLLLSRNCLRRSHASLSDNLLSVGCLFITYKTITIKFHIYKQNQLTHNICISTYMNTFICQKTTERLKTIKYSTNDYSKQSTLNCSYTALTAVCREPTHDLGNRLLNSSHVTIVQKKTDPKAKN